MSTREYASGGSPVPGRKTTSEGGCPAVLGAGVRTTLGEDQAERRCSQDREPLAVQRSESLRSEGKPDGVMDHRRFAAPARQTPVSHDCSNVSGRPGGGGAQLCGRVDAMRRGAAARGEGRAGEDMAGAEAGERREGERKADCRGDALFNGWDARYERGLADRRMGMGGC